MSRFDKYDPFSGGSRVPLAAAILAADVGKIQAVSINGSGRAVIGGPAETAVQGVIVADRPMSAGEPIDVMRSGEIVEATLTGGAAFAAGGIVYAHANGVVDSVSAAGKIIGKMVEATRMIVFCPVGTT